MKRGLYISIFLLMLTVSAGGQTDTVSLEEVIVTAGRTPVNTAYLNRSVAMIDSSMIQAIQPLSVHEVLEEIPALDIRKRGPLGVQADLSIRGGTYNQVLVLIDGFPVNDPQTGHHNLNLPVSPAILHKIEVLRGAASRAVGPDAFSGAVNMILRSPEKPAVDARFAAGQFGLMQSDLSAGFGKNGVHILGNFQRTVSDGYRPNTDFYQMQGLIRMAADTGNWHISLLGSWLDKAFGANSFYTPAFPDQYEAYRTWFGGMKVAYNKKIRIQQMIWWRNSFDRFELFRNDPAPWYTGHNYHNTNVYGTNLNLTIPWAGGQTSAGTDIKHQTIRSNVLGSLTGDSIAVPREAGAYYTRSASRTIINLFLEHRLDRNRFSLSGGGIISFIENSGWKLNGGVEAGFRTGRFLHTYFSVNQALRYPTFTELYYNSPTHAGDPDLLPEEALTLESGIRLRTSSVRGNLAFFHRRGHNLIDWGRSSDTLKWHSMNLTSLNTTGIESELTIDIRKLTENPDFIIHHATLSFYYADASKSSGKYLSKYVLDYLRWQGNFSVTHRIAGPFSASWRLRIQDRAGTFTEYPSGNEVAYPLFFVADGSVRMTLKHVVLALKADNLLNRNYYDLGNIPMPGRWISGSVRLRF